MKFRHPVRRLPSLLLLAAGLLPATHLPAQAPVQPSRSQSPIKVFHLGSVRSPNEADQLLVALRNILQPEDKIYLVYFTSDIVVQASEDDLVRAGQVLAQLDRPKPTYRLIYTLTESDSGKQIGVQHFSIIAVLGQRAQIKQGDKVPVVTGSYNTEKSSSETQFTYLDVGMNIDATLDQFTSTVLLHSRVEQSSVAAGPQGGKLADDPIVRQSLLEGTSVLTPGKPLTLGSLDIVGSTRHVDIEVVAEPIR